MKNWIIGLLLVILAVFLLPYAVTGAAHWLVVSDKLEPVDVIVVLSGDNNGERVDWAAKLYHQGYAKKLLLSGGPLAWQLTAAHWMKKQAISLGVPARSLILEDESESTIDNAQMSLAKLPDKVKSIGLVTSPTHSRRAKRVFKKVFSKAGIKVLSYPVSLVKSKFNIERWWTRHEDTQAVMWEYVTLVYYFLKGY